VALAAPGDDQRTAASPAAVAQAPVRSGGGPGDAEPIQILARIGPRSSIRGEMRAAARRIRAARLARLARERREAFAALPGGVSQATLDAIAACESGGDPTAVSADSSYRGKYQFSFETWASVGGSGDPAAASEAEQDYRAALLYAASGSSPWPICG
jgi:Transglycosylase-like domain